MIVGVQDVFYFVKDMGRAVRFYHDTLGLRLLEQSDTWSAFDVGGARFGLRATGGRPVPKGGGAVVTLRVRQIDTVVDHLRTLGVKFAGPVAYGSGGAEAQMEDPDGNVLRLLQPPR